MRMFAVATAAVALFNRSARPSIAEHSPGESIIVSTEWLAARLSDPAVVVLDVDHESDAYRDGHIPGVRFLDYMTVITSHDGLSTELPPASDLRQQFERLGV